jgi:hypothetical protein
VGVWLDDQGRIPVWGWLVSPHTIDRSQVSLGMCPLDSQNAVPGEMGSLIELTQFLEPARSIELIGDVAAECFHGEVRRRLECFVPG